MIPPPVMNVFELNILLQLSIIHHKDTGQQSLL